jgi:hypothetical protein|nr:MAG TPA: hypothetical protein [Caudoviricetes sp.]
MNKLLFSEGGQPLNLDDLEFMQTSTIDAIKALASPWGNCVLSNNPDIISSNGESLAWGDLNVCIDGKIALLPAGSFRYTDIDVNNTFVYIELTPEDRANKVFANATSYPTQRVYKAEVKAGILPEGKEVLPIFDIGNRRRINSGVGQKVRDSLISSSSVIANSLGSGISDLHINRFKLAGFSLVYGSFKVVEGVTNHNGHLCNVLSSLGSSSSWKVLVDGSDVVMYISYLAVAGSSVRSMSILDSSGNQIKALPAGSYTFSKLAY